LYHVFNDTFVEGRQKYSRGLGRRRKSKEKESLAGGSYKCVWKKKQLEGKGMNARERENRRETDVGSPRERECGGSAIDISAVEV
jgi:hypothetical protein